MLYKNIIGTSIALITLFINGCASFPQNEISEVKNMPNVSEFKNKPSIYVDFRFLRGEPNSKNSVEMLTVKEKLQPAIEKIFNESPLFSKVTFDEFKKTEVDYSLSVHIYNHGSSAAANISGFITGFTLGVIPGAATDNYTLKVKLLDKNGKIIKEERNKDSVTTWMGWIFLPMMSNTSKEAVISTITNQIKAVLKSLIEEGKLKYSANEFFYVAVN